MGSNVVCRNHNPVLSFFMTYHQVCNKSNTTAAKCGAGTVYLSGHPSSPSVLLGLMLLDLQFSMLCFVNYCLSFCLFSIVLSVLLRFTASGYSFGILDLRLLVTPLVSQIYDFWLLLWYLRFTASGYSFGILDLRLLITPLVSQIYDFWLLLWYLHTFLTCTPEAKKKLFGNRTIYHYKSLNKIVIYYLAAAICVMAMLPQLISIILTTI